MPGLTVVLDVNMSCTGRDGSSLHACLFSTVYVKYLRLPEKKASTISEVFQHFVQDLSQQMAR